MRKYNRYVIFFLFLALTVSCTVTREIPIEVWRTSEVKLPLDGKNIGFVYRNFKFDNDTLQRYYLNNDVLVKDFRTRSTDIDSILVSACLNSSAYHFKENHIGNSTIILPSDLFPRQNGEKVHPLPPALIRKLSQTSGVDYLIFLETITYFFSAYSDDESGDYQQVRMGGIWALYSGESGEISDLKTMVDTIYWTQQEGTDHIKFPPRFVALKQASEVFGENYAKRFYSDWIEVDRSYFVPPLEDFRIAETYMNEQKWDKAEEIWKRYSDPKFRRLAISACYNLALVSEIRDDLQKAIFWIGKAKEMARSYPHSDELNMSLLYASVLSKRVKEIEIFRQKGHP
jgi:tetratricopeptide (TPR) repeat protein